MFIIPSSPWLLAVSVIVLFLLHALWHSIQYNRLRKLHGCGPIAAYPQWDRIYGLDLALSQLKSLRNNTFIPWLAAMHKGRPSTFTVRFLGKRQIFTSETENLKAMTAIKVDTLRG